MCRAGLAMSGSILLVDHDDDGAGQLAGALRRRGYQVDLAASGLAALTWLRDHHVDVVLAHLRMPGMSGIELCGEVRAAHPGVLTVVVTGDAELESAIGAIRAGAYDYIVKPIELDVLVVALERAITHLDLDREVHRLRGVVAGARPVSTIIGDSPVIRRVADLVDKVAASDVSVLIVGESGTGKELVARAIHQASPRRDLPFVAVNCAALPAALLESELFGHVRGAFTDARRARPGLFVQAGGGTIFLDEIGEMPPEMQVKLLRALQERRVRPVGGDDEVPFAGRFLAATNRDLEADVAEHHFREDLYYRINVVQIAMPPLRARLGDLLPLAQHLIAKIVARTGTPMLGLSADAARVLLDYDWPGNVRELENCLERAIALASYDEIALDDLPDKLRSHRRTLLVTATGAPAELIPLAEVERRYVQQVLAAVGGNKAMAARVLGINRRSLYRRIDAADKPARASAPGTGAAMPPGATGDGRVVDHQGQVSVAGPGETNRVGPRPATEPS